MKRWLLTMTVLMIVAGVTQADTWNGRWGFGLEGGVWKQIGGDNDYSNVDQMAGLKLRYGLTDAMTLDVGFKYGWFRPGVEATGEDAGYSFDTGAGFYTRTWQPNITGTYRFVNDGTFRPWIQAGAGVTRWDVRDLRGEDSVGLWPDGAGIRVADEDGASVEGHGVNVTGIVGLGTEIAATSNLSFDLGVRYNYLLGQDRDSVGLSTLWDASDADVNSGILEGVVGANFSFGTTDSDGDGIPNDVDADPDNPEDFDGYRDDDGAPDPDNDNDGILDADDGAPNDPEDRDGFEDEDGVPDPDNDGDGIMDARDGAPNEAEDKDGYMDSDGVPDPDNDGDGVLDGKDACPGTPAGVEVDKKGCPVVEEIRDDLILEGVNFKTGSAELTGESAMVLNAVANSLKAWPEVKIEVGGYTDSTGSADGNKALSQRRADSVRIYLMNQGVSGSRVTAKGYGEERPIADNETKVGRAANRRVELKRTDR